MNANERIELLLREADWACYTGHADGLRTACGELVELLPAAIAHRAARVVKLAFEDPWTAAEEWKELIELLSAPAGDGASGRRYSPTASRHHKSMSA